MKKYQKPQIAKVRLSAKEQVLQPCRGGSQQDFECWIDYPVIPNDLIYGPDFE